MLWTPSSKRGRLPSARSIAKLAQHDRIFSDHALQYIHPQKRFQMRCKVQLYVAGKVFYEEVQAKDYDAARKVALARNPGATVISVNAAF